MSQYVVRVPDRVFSDTVLLFESRMRHPALRVTCTKKLFKINWFFHWSATKIDKNWKKTIFHFFHFFRKIVVTFVRNLTLAITYRPQMSIAHLNRLNEISPKMNSNQKSNVWSSMKNSHLYLRGTFYVARVRRDNLPWHRITLRVEDETSCSTSHYLILTYLCAVVPQNWKNIQKI